MTWFRVLFLLIAIATTGRASVTVGWKMPVERIEPTKGEDAEALEKPPGESAFFQPGDKLFDLSGEINWRFPANRTDAQPFDPSSVAEDKQVQAKWRGDWIVWNSRSNMLIARGSWNDIVAVEKVFGFFERPIVVRTRVELSDAGNSRKLSLISRSGHKAWFDFQGLNVKVEPTTDTTPYSYIDNRLEISWPVGSLGVKWEVVSKVALEDGRTLRLARQGTWQLFVSATRELADGTPWSEARWIERECSLCTWLPPHWTIPPDLKQIDANRVLGIYRSFSPFLEKDREKGISGVSPDIDAPVEIQEWVRGPLVDVRKTLEERGIKCDGEGEFAGYDPVSDLCFILARREIQEMTEAIFGGHMLDNREFLPPIWIETNPEAGGWGLVSRSGERAHICKSSGNGGGKGDESELVFECEPTQGADGTTFDLRYAIDAVGDDRKIGEIVGNTTLMKDKHQVLGSSTTPDGNEVKVTVTVSELSAEIGDE